MDAFRATQPQHQRSAAFARDGGVCSLCGLQTERIRQAVVRWVDRRARRSEWWTRHRRVPRGFGACDVSRLLNRLGLATSDSLGLHLGCARLRSSWWDLDHRVPIADGGHPYDLRNLRTLCVWCHQDETARAATARAEARRGWVEPEAAQVLLFADSVQRIRMGLDA